MTNPVKKINMLDAVKLFFKNYFNFTGRASRSEYWWFVLAYFIMVILALCIDASMVWYYNTLSMFDGIDYSSPYDVYYSPMIATASPRYGAFRLVAGGFISGPNTFFYIFNSYFY